jgi:hypothetical protein
MMKKKYTPPKLTLIGDMVSNTLGASGTVSDGASRRTGGGYGNANGNNFNRQF